MLITFRVLRILLFPFLRYIAPLFSKNIAARIDFEFQNWIQVPMLKQADYGFEVSSEGELEQIKVVLLHVLEQGATVELIFCSPSVEAQCLKLQTQYPQRLRLYRFPLFCYNPLSEVANPLNWLTCKTLVMCRYDFFPELIYYGKYRAEKFILLAASLKNFENKNFVAKAYLKECYQSFDQIISITQVDAQTFKDTFAIESEKISFYDFRLAQIANRLRLKDTTISEKLLCGKALTDLLKQTHKKKIILGSYWHSENILSPKIIEKHTQLEGMIFIAPHDLNPETTKQIKKDLGHLQAPLYHITTQTTAEEFLQMCQQAPKLSLWLMDVKGILCELYGHFDVAYVGGGFGVSIHSVLEPFVAGASVVCGPKVHRSTEFTLIKENFPDRLVKVENALEVLDEIIQLDVRPHNEIREFILAYSNKQNTMLTWLGMGEVGNA